MRAPSCRRPLLAGALSAGVLLAAGGPDSARADGWTPAGAPLVPVGADVIEVEAVGLAAVRAEPARWLGRRVRFVLQMRGVVEDWNPWFSRFSPEGWQAFGGWPDESYTWDPVVFDDPCGRLFVRTGTSLEHQVRAAPAYARYAVTGVVREIFLNEPWIEVEGLERLTEAVGSGTILHVGRALELMERGEWELALEQLDRARQGPLPEHARAELVELRARCVRARAEIEALREKLG